MNRGAELVVDAVTVRFGGTVALSEASLRVAPGTVHGLIGPNGAGKTTLFDVVTGFVSPTSGRIHVDDVDITRSSPRARIRRGVRRSFQGAELFGDLTVRANLEVAQPRRPQASADRLLERMGLTQYADARAQDVPSGVQRVVGIARALAGEPRALLLDEPGAGLQGSEVVALANQIAAICRDDGVTTLLVDHDMELIELVCEQVTVLDFGKVIATDSPVRIKQDSAVLEAYLGA